MFGSVLGTRSCPHSRNTCVLRHRNVQDKTVPYVICIRGSTPSRQMSKRSLGFGFRSSRGTTTTNPLGGSTHRLSAATCIASFPSRAERRSKLPSKASPFGDRARCSSAAKHRESPPAYRRAHEWPSRDVQVHLFSMDHVQTSSRRYPRLLCVDPSLDSIRLEGSPSSSSAPCARSQWELGRRRRRVGDGRDQSPRTAVSWRKGSAARSCSAR
jgi:hypothetical protein